VFKITVKDGDGFGPNFRQTNYQLGNDWILCIPFPGQRLRNGLHYDVIRTLVVFDLQQQSLVGTGRFVRRQPSRQLQRRQRPWTNVAKTRLNGPSLFIQKLHKHSENGPFTMTLRLVHGLFVCLVF